ncbi:MAG: glycerol-3-phosphate dehydrogenase [Rhizobiales bacterium]|jgi:glycerol-3-phosphate dehydrogenase|nr:glycerol-3-phosphate dehydrogenase [Hyphomicrobiales bacterium]
MKEFDVAIIGGGINGCGIARDAAGRGLSVLLIEQGDLASGTSSYSSKMIHGGIRYLEHYDFRLVRESLHERELLLKNAPHLVRPMRFVIPHVASMRPAWMMKIGIRLYDFLAGRSVLPKSRVLDLADDPAGAPLRASGGAGFEYSDCVADDARLVIANAIDAQERGADIRTKTRLVSARRVGQRWELVLAEGVKRETLHARALVNAAGPWAGSVIETIVKGAAPVNVRLVKGSHIVYPRLYTHDRAYVLQNNDGRIIFAIPFGEKYTLIGTTDVEIAGDPGHATASAEEIQYLCRLAEHFFKTAVEPSRVVWTFAGVRPLIDDGKGSASSATREYKIVADGSYGEAPLLSLIGGKLTAYRAMSEDVVNKLGHWLAMRAAWTANEPLPGGDLGARGFDGLLADLARDHAYLPAATARRIAHAYGRRVMNMLGDAKKIEDLGVRLAGDLHARELAYLREHEWAKTADDVLFRRTKLGVGASQIEIDAVKTALAA